MLQSPLEQHTYLTWLVCWSSAAEFWVLCPAAAVGKHHLGENFRGESRLAARLGTAGLSGRVGGTGSRAPARCRGDGSRRQDERGVSWASVTVWDAVERSGAVWDAVVCRVPLGGGGPHQLNASEFETP